MPDDASSKMQQDAPSKTLYLPDSRYSVGPFAAINAIVREIFQYRSHALTLFSNDFKASYRGTTFGVLWNFILPLVPISVYLLLVNIRVFPAYDGMEPALFLGFNVMFWYFITGLVLRPIDVVKSKAASSMKTSLPLSVAISSSFAQLCFDGLVRLGLVVALVLVFRDWPNPNFLGLIFTLLVSLTFCLSAGLIFSIFNMAYSDTQRLVGIFLQYGLFLSGVIFPMSSMGRISILEVWNPFAVFVGASRDYLFVGSYAHPEALGVWGFISLVMLITGVRFFYTMEQRVRGLT